MIFTFTEIIYLLVLVFTVGFIFSGFIQRPVTDPLERVLGHKKRFNWSDIKYAMLVAAPAVLLHELAHKFTAIAYGLEANFFIWPTGIIIGVLLKIIGSGFILLAPGFVSTMGATAGQGAVIALAGPLMNALLWGASFLIVKYGKNLSREKAMFFGLMGKINMWLFFFNMIPIPPLDGSHVFSYLFGLI
jgi:Zn-dependent protease